MIIEIIKFYITKMHLSFELRISQRQVYDGNVPETKKWIGTNKQNSYFFIRFYYFFLQLWKPVWQSLKTEIVSLLSTLGEGILYYASETFRSNFMAIIIMSYEKIKVTRNKTYVCGSIKIILNTVVLLFLAFYFFFTIQYYYYYMYLIFIFFYLCLRFHLASLFLTPLQTCVSNISIYFLNA